MSRNSPNGLSTTWRIGGGLGKRTTRKSMSVLKVNTDVGEFYFMKTVPNPLR